MKLDLKFIYITVLINTFPLINISFGYFKWEWKLNFSSIWYHKELPWLLTKYSYVPMQCEELNTFTTKNTGYKSWFLVILAAKI